MKTLKVLMIILNLLAGLLTHATMIATHVNQIGYATHTYEELLQAGAINLDLVKKVFPDTSQDTLYTAVHFIEPRSIITKRGWPISAIFYANTILIGLFMGRKPKPNANKAE